MQDQFGRNIDYLRISVTDRCNLRCEYCMPQEGICRMEHQAIMRFEEIVTVCRCMVRLGIRKVKITGGEPLVQKDLIKLIQMIRDVPEIEEITLTTNGVLLEEYAEALKEAGVKGVNISLDTLSRERYQKLTGSDQLNQVLSGIEKAVSVGFDSVKINTVVIRDWNEDEVAALTGLAKDKPICVRFIELMPLGMGKTYCPVHQEDIVKKLEERYGSLARQTTRMGNGPAVYYDIPGFEGKVGFISALSHEFCGNCNRIRLTADGKLKLCLQYKEGINLKELIRKGMSEEALTETIRMTMYHKPQNHEFINDKTKMNLDVESRGMSQIGG